MVLTDRTRFVLLSIAATVLIVPARAETPPKLDSSTPAGTPPRVAPGQFKDADAKSVLPKGYNPNKEIAEATAAIGKNPKDALSYERMAAAYNRTEQFDKAVEYASKAISLDPKLASSWTQRGYAQYKLGKLKEALADLNKAILLNPKLGAAYSARANVYCKMEKYGQALADAKIALKLNPNDPAAHVAYGRAAHPLGRYGDAVAAASRAIKMNPSDPTGWDNRGLAYTQMNQFAAAISDFNQAIKLRPNEPKYVCHRGIVYLMKGDYPHALSDLSAAIKLKPDYSLAHFNRGVAYYLMGKYELSHNDIKTAIHYDPHYALAWYVFPLDPLKGPKEKEAMDSPSDYYYRATTRILLMRNEMAIADLKKYLELAGWQAELSHDSVLLMYLGHMRNNQDALAKAVLDEADTKCDKTKFQHRVVSFLRGEMSEEELLKQAGDNEQETQARAMVGLHHWLSERKAKATHHFTWLKTNGHGAVVPYSLALRELEKQHEKKTQETERFYDNPIH